MYCFSVLVKYLKVHSDNPKVSDAKFLNDFILPFVQACGIENKTGEEFCLNAGRVSRLLSGKDEVPEALRAKIDSYQSIDKTTREMAHFMTDHFDKADRVSLTNGILGLASESGAVTKGEYDHLRSHSDNLDSFLTQALFLSLRKTNIQQAERNEIFRTGPFRTCVKRGDILDIAFDKRLKAKRIVVIPVNDRFSTHVENRIEGCGMPEVSDITIHGKWLMRMEQSGEDMTRVRQRIKDDLALRGYEEKASYPIGTIVTLDKGPVTFFLIVVSTFDEINNARSDQREISKALSCLIASHDRYGQGRELLIPLIGSGLSRARLSAQDSFDLIIETIKKNQEMISGDITLVVFRNQPERIQYEGRSF